MTSILNNVLFSWIKSPANLSRGRRGCCTLPIAGLVAGLLGACQVYFIFFDITFSKVFLKNLTKSPHRFSSPEDWRGKVVFNGLGATLHLSAPVIQESMNLSKEESKGTENNTYFTLNGFVEDFTVTDARIHNRLEFVLPNSYQNPSVLEAQLSPIWSLLGSGICTITFQDGSFMKNTISTHHMDRYKEPYASGNQQVILFETTFSARINHCTNTTLIIANVSLSWQYGFSNFVDVPISCPSVSQNKVAMCLPPVTQDFPMNRLVEFFAYHSLLGVKNFYIFSRYRETTERLQQISAHKSIGNIHITSLGFCSNVGSTFENYWYYEHLLWINHCARVLARSSKWVSILEFDEYLVNEENIELADLISQLSEGHTSLSMHGPNIMCRGNEYFLTDCIKVKNDSGRSKPIFSPNSFSYTNFHNTFPSTFFPKRRKTLLVHFRDGVKQRSKISEVEKESIAEYKLPGKNMLYKKVTHEILDRI